jgi:hypothetical protein
MKPASDLTDEEIHRRMREDGFPEMEALWRQYERLPPERREPGEDVLLRARRQHMGALVGHPFVMLVTPTAVALLAFRYFFDFIPLLASSARTPALVLMAALFAFNAAFLFWYVALTVQRYLVHSMGEIMALDLAHMLRKRDYRRWLDGLPRSRGVVEGLRALGVSDIWDDPEYRARYLLREGDIKRLPDQDPHAFVQAVLREVLGYKDGVTRRFQPGRYYDSLKRKKRSVTAFVAKNQEQIRQNKAGELPVGEGITLLRELRDDHVEPGTPGEKRLTDCIEAIESGHYLTGGTVQAEIWQRDPWVDLTHQEEFFSSASLRGVKWFGRGPKGRLGTFGYLRNKSISALDFRTRRGRAVRARLGAAITRDADGRARPVLFVDGVEGSNAVSPRLVATALRDYAEAAGFALVGCNHFSHNAVPRRFARHLGRMGAPLREMTLRYADDSEREYLDAFTLPVEPFEYAHPRGTVVGRVLPVDGSLHVGTEPRLLTRLVAGLRLEALWIVTGSALGCTLWMMWHVSPVAFGTFAALAALAIAAHLLIQRRSLREPVSSGMS